MSFDISSLETIAKCSLTYMEVETRTHSTPHTPRTPEVTATLRWFPDGFILAGADLYGNVRRAAHIQRQHCHTSQQWPGKNGLEPVQCASCQHIISAVIHRRYDMSIIGTFYPVQLQESKQEQKRQDVIVNWHVGETKDTRNVRQGQSVNY